MYVVGGLYGNPYALEKILEMAERENVKIGHKPAIFYNGDFNFFNSHSVHDFLLVNKMIMQSGGIASLGNIEDFIINACADPASLLDSETWDCGCDYPPFVSDAYVQRSNRIAARIGHVAQAALARDSSVIEWMRSLPNHHAIELGAGAEGERTRRVVVLHGDCWSLSGWRFAAEALPTSGGGRVTSCHPSCPNSSTSAASASSSTSSVGSESESEITTLAELSTWLDEAGADVFATTHTCLPVAVAVPTSRGGGVLINNGSAGMPNFTATEPDPRLGHSGVGGGGGGVITRISIDLESPPQSLSLYHHITGRKDGDTDQAPALRVDALRVPYDHEQWHRTFQRWWPPRSDAHESYAPRIAYGPSYSIEQAIRDGFR